MSSVFKFFDDIIITSNKNAQESSRKPTSWRICVALMKAGWKAYKCERVQEPECDDVVFTWQKDGRADLKVRLSFTEQCLWIEYLEKNKSTATK